MTTRKELIEAVGARYRGAATSEKKTILDEFVALTGYQVADNFVMLKPSAEWPDPDRSKTDLVAGMQEAVMKIPGNKWYPARSCCGWARTCPT